MDFVGPFPTGENLLPLVDYYSRYPEVEIMKHITTAALEPRLRRIFARYGVPQEIVTDNAKTFRSSRFSNLMRKFGIKHKKITPRYPRANGEAERLNRSINKVVKTAIAEPRDWRKAIDAWLLAYRTTPHTVTGQPQQP
jgi:transposase InsO family protein